MDSFYPRRQWAGKNLPAISSFVTSPLAADQAEMILSLLKVHHLHIEILRSLGADPSKEYEHSREKNVLARILPGVKKCSICKKECFNTQKLKNHMEKESPS